MTLLLYQNAWSRRVREYVALRDARRALAAARPPLTPAPGTSLSAAIRAAIFEPYDAEWSCDSKRKIGTPK
jgi:hypothetical protein